MNSAPPFTVAAYHVLPVPQQTWHLDAFALENRVILDEFVAVSGYHRKYAEDEGGIGATNRAGQDFTP